jgi:uncharacterized protein YndB with AHSA1/START domain
MTDTKGSQDAVVIERSFDAPADLIWQMWTDPEHLKEWFGPAGATIPVAKLDVRVGGSRLICMQVQTPAGPRSMWFAGEYLQVVANQLLVYTEFISDENGNVVLPGEMGTSDGHPTTTEVRVELKQLDAITKMVMTHRGIPSDSPGAAGWTMALDKLAAHVAASIRL